MNTTNQPYVTVYDPTTGKIINPIIPASYDLEGNVKNSGTPYITTDKNRKERRNVLQKQRFYGESKNYHLTIVGTDKYKRFRQEIKMFNDKGKIVRKFIGHYILR